MASNQELRYVDTGATSIQKYSDKDDLAFYNAPGFLQL